MLRQTSTDIGSLVIGILTPWGWLPKMPTIVPVPIDGFAPTDQGMGAGVTLPKSCAIEARMVAR